MDQPCTPWLGVEDVTRCTASDFEPGLLADAVTAAISWLYILSGRKYPGICIDIWRPCLGPCGSHAGCGCTRYPVIELRYGPVLDAPAIEVEIDGAPLAEGTGWILDRTGLTPRLVRVDGELWPSCQDIGATTGEGVWSITYPYGRAPVPGYVAAVSVLACEIAVAQTPGATCRLPRRAVSIVREGVTVQMFDPFEFLREGKLGLYEVDAWLTAAGTDPEPRVLNPDMWPEPLPRDGARRAARRGDVFTTWS